MISTWNKSYTATRKTAGTTDDDGFYTPGSTTSVPFSGTIMRMSDKERENLPEGQRTTETIKIYTDTDLYVTNITAGTKGDIVTYKGNDYEIVGRLFALRRAVIEQGDRPDLVSLSLIGYRAEGIEDSAFPFNFGRLADFFVLDSLLARAFHHP